MNSKLKLIMAPSVQAVKDMLSCNKADHSCSLVLRQNGFKFVQVETAEDEEHIGPYKADFGFQKRPQHENKLDAMLLNESPKGTLTAHNAMDFFVRDPCKCTSEGLSDKNESKEALGGFLDPNNTSEHVCKQAFKKTNTCPNFLMTEEEAKIEELSSQRQSGESTSQQSKSFECEATGIQHLVKSGEVMK